MGISFALTGGDRPEAEKARGFTTMEKLPGWWKALPDPGLEMENRSYASRASHGGIHVGPCHHGIGISGGSGQRNGYNKNPYGRIYNIVQHPTIGPPFLMNTYRGFQGRGFMQERPMPNLKKRSTLAAGFPDVERG